jgi:hypothetical protein
MTHLAGINAEGAVLRQKTSRQFAATQHSAKEAATTASTSRFVPVTLPAGKAF